MDPTIARLRYLNDSAHLLAFSSPSSAAVFQSRYDQVVEDNSLKLSDTRLQEICSACGFNMLLTASYKPQPYKSQSQDPRGEKGGGPKRRLHEKTSKPTSKENKKILLECQACLSITKMELPITKPSRSSSKRISQPEVTTSSSFNPKSPPSKAASTKAKRTKTRNSLQAMLAKSKEQGKSEKGFGFDLMDLMKST